MRSRQRFGAEAHALATAARRQSSPHLIRACIRRRSRHCVRNGGTRRRAGYGSPRWGKAARSRGTPARLRRRRARHASGSRLRSGAGRRARARLSRSWWSSSPPALYGASTSNRQRSSVAVPGYSKCPGTISPSTMCGGTYLRSGSLSFGVTKLIRLMRPMINRTAAPTRNHRRGASVH